MDNAILPMYLSCHLRFLLFVSRLFYLVGYEYRNCIPSDCQWPRTIAPTSSMDLSTTKLDLHHFVGDRSPRNNGQNEIGTKTPRKSSRCLKGTTRSNPLPLLLVDASILLGLVSTEFNSLLSQIDDHLTCVDLYSQLRFTSERQSRSSNLDHNLLVVEAQTNWVNGCRMASKRCHRLDRSVFHGRKRRSLGASPLSRYCQAANPFKQFEPYTYA